MARHGFHTSSGAVVTRATDCSPRRGPTPPSERDDASRSSRPADGVVADSSPLASSGLRGE